MRLSFSDLKDALSTASVMPFRVLLAFASAVYAVLTMYGWLTLTDCTRCSPVTAYVLQSGWGYGWAMIFGLNSLCMWWRILDDSPVLTHSRRAWAIGINIFTVSLWGTLTVATMITGPVIAPGIVGYFNLDIMAALVLARTEWTWRDRVTL